MRAQHAKVRKVREKMYRVGICDDGEQICAHMEKIVQNYAQDRMKQMETMLFYSGETLCDYLKQGNRLDILFLDIELFEISGIQVGDFIRNQLQDRSTQIIYISGKSGYAMELFKMQPLDFLVKPSADEKVYEVLDRADKELQRANIMFEYRLGKDFFRIPYGQIRMFISYGRKVEIVTDKGKFEYYGKLKDLKEKLPCDFLMIHQSYIVNINFVRRFTYEEAELMDDTFLTISRPYRKPVRQELLRRCMEE